MSIWGPPPGPTGHVAAQPRSRAAARHFHSGNPNGMRCSRDSDRVGISQIAIGTASDDVTMTEVTDAGERSEHTRRPGGSTLGGSTRRRPCERYVGIRAFRSIRARPVTGTPIFPMR